MKEIRVLLRSCMYNNRGQHFDASTHAALFLREQTNFDVVIVFPLSWLWNPLW